MLPVLHTQQAADNSVSYVAEHDCNAPAIARFRSAPRPLSPVYWKSHQCHGAKFGGKVNPKTALYYAIMLRPNESPDNPIFNQ
jgi:hypothetical protein